MKGERKIGLFDSGLGGLTVLQALETVLPGVPKVYYGDTLHLPYGDKSDSAIIRYSTRIVQFLKDEGCELIVIACNSASAAAGAHLVQAFPELVFINVIDPVVKSLATGPHKNVGLLGTRATIRSGAYANRLGSLNGDINLCSLSTPLLVPLIEEGFLGTGIDESVLQHYLKDPILTGVEALVPGCTHYPLLQQTAEKLLGSVEWIDAPTIVAKQVAAQWGDDRPQGTTSYYLSDKTEGFLAMAAQIFGIQAQWQLMALPE